MIENIMFTKTNVQTAMKNKTKRCIPFEIQFSHLNVRQEKFAISGEFQNFFGVLFLQHSFF